MQYTRVPNMSAMLIVSLNVVPVACYHLNNDSLKKSIKPSDWFGKKIFLF